MKTNIALLILLSISTMSSAIADETLKKSSLFTEASDSSEQIKILEKGAEVKVLDHATDENKQEWLKIETAGKTGFIRASAVKITGSSAVTEPAKKVAPFDVVDLNWDPQWIVSTSPIGDLSHRYNFEFTKFMNKNFTLSLKTTFIDNGPQGILGHDKGLETGIRATQYFVKAPTIWIGGNLGIFYAKIDRGDYLSDAFDSAFRDISNYVDRDEVNGPMFEALGSVLVHFGKSFIVEGMGGLEGYQVNYYKVDTTTKVKTARKDSEFNIYPVIEFNFGVSL